MANYKALQNKALHKGTYISLGIADGDTWTTNGQIMVRKFISSDETAALKDQQDDRLSNESPTDLQFVIDKMKEFDDKAVTSRVKDVVEWENEAGLQLVKAIGHDGEEVSVQQVYVDYINALFANDGMRWYMTPAGMTAAIDDSSRDTGMKDVAYIARVDPIKDVKVNEGEK